MPNYSGRMRQLWQFAIEAVLEEEVRPQLHSWSFRQRGDDQIYVDDSVVDLDPKDPDPDL